jgi:hypothetical protein
MKTIPARISSEMAAELLGFNPTEISILISKKKLKPLGSPNQNSPKHFARVQIEEVGLDPKWLDEATRVIASYWRIKNQRRIKVGAVRRVGKNSTEITPVTN